MSSGPISPRATEAGRSSAPAELPRADGPLHAPDDELPGRRRSTDVLGRGVEVSERPGEHHLAQHRVVPDESAKGMDRGHDVAFGVRALVESLEPRPQATE